MTNAWLPFVALFVGIAAFSLVLLVAVRSRNLFSPKLTFAFRLPLNFGVRRTGYMRRDPVALFFMNERYAHTSVCLPIYVRNNSRRKIADITLDLEFPRSFCVTNRALAEMRNSTVAHFPDREDEVAIFSDWATKRSVKPNGDMVLVSYKLGPLLPGQDQVIYESLEMPSREQAFSDERFEGKMFGSILNRLKQLKSFRGVCHVRAALYTDLLKPRFRWVNIVSMKGVTESSLEDLILPYALAHWLGKFPKGRYFRPLMPFPKAYRQPLSRKSTVDIVRPKMVLDTTSTPDHHIAVEWFEPQNSSYAVGFAALPGYDYHSLPAAYSVDDALLSIGFGKPLAMMGKSRAPR